jgi:Kef-type K+ transport system membrane component KefB
MNPLLLLMGLLLVAYLGSFLVGGERSIGGVGLPSSVEWVVLGAVIGPSALGVVSTSVVDGVESVVTVGLSWLLFTAGVRYATTSRGNISFARVLVALCWSLATAGAVFAAVYFGVARIAPELVKDRLVLALALAAVSCETTRHVMRWVRERYDAHGPLIDLLEDIACSEDVVPMGILVALTALAGKSKLAWLGVPTVSGITIGLGAILGALCAQLLGREFRLRESWGTVLGFSLLAIGVSAMVGIAFVVVLFVMGVVLALASKHADEVRAMLQPTERGALLPLLIVCGVRLEPRAIWHTLAIFGIVFVARVLAKLVLARTLTAVNPDARRAGGTVGFGMMSAGAMSMCIGLVCAIAFPGQVGSTVLAVAAALCIAGELVGPPALRAALRRVDELHEAPKSSETPPQVQGETS